MLSLKIESGDVKAFMNTLLTSETFDSFEVRGVDITTLTHFNISGQKLSSDKNEASPGDIDKQVKAVYCKWGEIRPFILNIVKGGTKPAHIKIIFSMEPEETLKLHENGAAMYLNIQYNGEEIYFTSATAQKGFSLDKSLDHVWEDYLKEFFRVNEIKTKEVEME